MCPKFFYIQKKDEVWEITYMMCTILTNQSFQYESSTQYLREYPINLSKLYKTQQSTIFHPVLAFRQNKPLEMYYNSPVSAWAIQYISV